MRDDVVEDLAVGVAEEEHRRGPLRRIPREQCLAPAADRLVDRETVGDRAVELGGELGGGAVADGELHGDDGDAVLLDQALGHAAERVGAVHAGRLARVEEDQAKGVVVAKVGAEHAGGHRCATAVAVGEVDDAVLASCVVLAVPDEVEHVDVVLAKPPRQGLQRRLFQPVEVHGVFGHPPGHSALDASPLGLDVELGQVGRGRDDDEDAEGAVDVEGAWGQRHLEVANDRGAFGLRDVAALTAVVEELPGQHRDGRRLGQPEPQPQAAPGRANRVEASRPGEPDVAAEDGVEEAAAQLLRGLRLRVGGDAPRPGTAGVELEHEVLELGRLEGDPEGSGRAVAGRRLEDARAVLTVGLRLDEEVEVVVLPGGHGHLPAWSLPTRVPQSDRLIRGSGQTARKCPPAS